jgi:hypothetical protein
MYIKINTYFLIILIISLSFSSDKNQSVASVDSPAGLNRLSWIAGLWQGENAGIEVEEIWLEAKGGLMLGMNRTFEKEKKPFFEYLRIAEEDTGIYYHANPAGRPATSFRLVDLQERKVVFENLEHDFPQRIIYRLEDQDSLVTRAEGMIKGQLKFQEWQLKKVKKRY